MVTVVVTIKIGLDEREKKKIVVHGAEKNVGGSEYNADEITIHFCTYSLLVLGVFTYAM